MNAGTEGTIDTKRLIFPALGGLYQSIAPYSYAIIRFCAGAIVIYHGYMKLFGGFAGPVEQNVLTPLGFPRPLAWARPKAWRQRAFCGPAAGACDRLRHCALRHHASRL